MKKVGLRGIVESSDYIILATILEDNLLPFVLQSCLFFLSFFQWFKYGRVV